MRRGAATVTAAFVAGAALRLARWDVWPGGPWIDEAYALRAARLLAADPSASWFGTSPLQPPDAGFVNSYTPNLYLIFAGAVDRLAGGGIASFRMLSILPALLLLAAGLLLAREASRERPGALAFAAAPLATSAWLLTTARWGWDAVATSAVLALAGAAALGAARKGSVTLATVAGGLLGLAQYGYVGARLVLPLPVAALAWVLVRRRGPESRAPLLLGAALAATVLVAAPLGLHLAAHPERATARVRNLAAGENVTGVRLARSVLDHALLFLIGGDLNERHGDPGRPVLPPALGALALVGAVAGRKEPLEGLLAGTAGLLVLGGVVAEGTDGPNAYRISPAAPFLLVLAGVGAARLVRLIPERRTLAAAALALVVGVSAVTEAAAFLSWASSPRTRGAFGGPERELADALAAERRSSGEADVVLGRGAARNPFVVDVLLGAPRGGGRPVVRLAALGGPRGWRFLPRHDILYADADGPALRGVLAGLGARRVAEGRPLENLSGWTLYRIPREAAVAAARRDLAGLPLLPAPQPLAAPAVPAPGERALVVPDEGVYTFESREGLLARLDGAVLFDPVGRPAGSLSVRLGPGRHRVETTVGRENAGLRVTGPDGFVVAL